jgi:hypothetical protein
MDPHLIEVFKLQIETQCQFLLLGKHQLDEGLAKHGYLEVFAALQAILTASANISKACWGQSGSMETERKPLRDSLGISDTSPLRSTTVRNSFDHFDDRLDTWWAHSKTKNLADLNIGSTGHLSGFQVKETFRHYDPTTQEIIFWGKRISVDALVKEAETLLKNLS